MSGQDGGRIAPSTKETEPQVRVIRTNVRSGLKYREYRKQLRWDFLYSCAYCTIAESESTAISFDIDHYEPSTKRPDLEDTYVNLMYACHLCNVRKGKRCPADAERQAGHRFFKADVDVWEEHFRESGIRIEGTSNTGRYTELALDLNRKLLLKLREIRNRARIAVEAAMQEVTDLQQYHFDDLPADIRLSALRLIRDAAETRIKLQGNLDDLLREYARSKLEDGDDPTEEDIRQNKERLRRLREIGALHADQWSGRKPRRKK
jgi:hypothetical protein